MDAWVLINPMDQPSKSLEKIEIPDADTRCTWILTTLANLSLEMVRQNVIGRFFCLCFKDTVIVSKETYGLSNTFLLVLGCLIFETIIWTNNNKKFISKNPIQIQGVQLKASKSLSFGHWS